MKPKCSGCTKKGAPCPWTTLFSDGRCIWHSEQPEAIARRSEIASARGKVGGKQTWANKRAATDTVVEPVALRNDDDMLGALETLYGAAGKAGDMALQLKVIGQAHAIVSAAVDDRQATIDELLAERPELAKALEDRRHEDRPAKLEVV